MRRVASNGTQGAGERLPFLDTIQRSFGSHDATNIQAHSDEVASLACADMNAEAYASGSHVAFRRTPDLHTAAHEAAHVVQQRGGVQLKGGIGVEGDQYERHADAVADTVVRGGSAQALLDQVGGGSRIREGSESGSPAIQLKGWFGESVDDAREGLEAAQDVPEREHHTDGGAEKIAPGRFRIWGFAVDSAEMPPGVSAALDEVARLYAGDPKSRVTIEGHTSQSGTERHNADLATRRANQVLALLLYRGLSPTRLEATGSGESAPLAREGQNALLMARNRRVEITYHGEIPVAPPPVHAADKAKVIDSGVPAQGCRDAKSNARMLRVYLQAWVDYSGSRGGGTIRGHRDPGLDSASIAPDRMQIIGAARLQGYHSTKEWDYFVDVIKMDAGRNLDAHMRELKRDIEVAEKLASQPGVTCDPAAPLVVKPFDPDERHVRHDRLNPEPNTQAPGGQRY